MRSSVIAYSKNQHQVEQRWGSNIHEQRIFSYLFCTDIYENNRMDLFLRASVCGWGIWASQMMTCSLECSKQRGNITFLCIKQSELCFSRWSAQNGSSSFSWCWYCPIWGKLNPLCLILSPPQQQETSANVQFSYAFKEKILLLQTYIHSQQLSNIILTFCNNGWNGKVILSYRGNAYW